MKKVNNELRISHFAQVPCKPFTVPVEDEEQAKLIMDILAYQHLFLNQEHIISDYSNTITVEMLDDDGEWTDYWNEDECMEWDEFEETYLQTIAFEEWDFNIRKDNGLNF